jgi:hypothetical protein
MARVLRGRLIGVAFAVGLLTPSIAHADPITTAIVAVVNVLVGAGVAAAVGNFLVAFGSVIYTSAASWALSKTSGSKAAAARDRQASVAAMTVGEVPREMLLGEAGTGGSLVDVFWFGGSNNTDWNVLVIAVADHRCHSLTGFQVNDTYVAYTGDGFVPGYNNQLRVYWRAGTGSDAALPGDLSGLGPATATGALKGVARVIVAYKADAPDAQSPIWTTGRPSFVWVVKGLLCYDPRKDSTVSGGSGSHRWDDPSTREWSDNAEICRYNYSRGSYYLEQVDQPTSLMLGRGLSVYEAPPERVFAPANLCDELVTVTDATTGSTFTEPRYRVGGVISADQTFDTVEQWFADAMAGQVIQPEGGVAVDPGQAKSPVFEITDDDLVVGSAVQWSNELSDADRINSVVVSYVEPDQKWSMTTAGVLRDETDIAQDGGPKELQLGLVLVRHRSQALRIGEIRRRGARLERRGVLTLPPEWAGIEEGDWGTYTSERRTGGEPVTVRVTKYGVDQAWRNTLALEETAYSVYGFGGPEVVPPIVPVMSPVGALALAGVTATAIVLSGTDGSALPAVRITWTTPVDSAITSIRAEVRPNGGTAVTPTSTSDVNAGLLNITAGVPSAGFIQVRLVPLGVPGRAITPSSWITLLSGSFVSPPGGTDTTPPSAPSSVTYDAAFQTIFLSWTDPSDGDLDKVEIWEATVNSFGSATKLKTVAARPGGRNSTSRSGLGEGVTRYYWLRAIDKSGNASSFSSVLAATTAYLPMITETRIADDSISTPLLKTNVVVASKVTAHTLTADKGVFNEIDTQYLKNNALANAGFLDITGSTLIGTSPYTNISSGGLYVAVQSTDGSYTTVDLDVWVQCSNDDPVNQVGLWVDLVLSGAVSTTLTGASLLVEPGNPGVLPIPFQIRTNATGNILIVVGAWANLTGGSSQLYATRVKLRPSAIYKS